MNREDRNKVSEFLGIHHITAIGDDPQRNIGFHTGFMEIKRGGSVVQKLLLPKWLEPDRKYLEKSFQRLRLSLNQFFKFTR